MSTCIELSGNPLRNRTASRTGLNAMKVSIPVAARLKRPRKPAREADRYER